MINKLISFLFGIKKSKFKTTDSELENIENTPNHNDINIVEEKDFEELSDVIFNEALEKFKLNHSNQWDPKITSLNWFRFLSKQSLPIKKEFLYHLTKEVIAFNSLNNVIFNIQKEQYLKEIIHLVLRFSIPFTEKDFIYFLRFWEQYPDYITLGLLTSKLLKKAKKSGINRELDSYLKKFLKNKNFSNNFYSYYKTPRNTIQKALHTYTINKEVSEPSFLLLSDPFADYINKFIKSTDQKKQEAYCQIFKTFETNKEFYNPFKLLAQVEEHIDSIGTDAYKKQVIDFIKKASEFKPKMQHLRVNKRALRPREVTYNCQYMKKENIAILKSMILSIVIYGDKKNVIPYLIRITERSFSNANALRLGETSRSLGKLCIYTLIFHYDQKGKEEIKKLYRETTSKGIKNTISKYSKLNSKNILE